MVSSPDLTVRGIRLAAADDDFTPLQDLHLRAGHITAITPAGSVPSTGAVLDGGGRIAVPGFIDAHVHGEAAVFDPEVQLAMLRQGITTIVTGQDGVSYAPSPPGTHAARWASEYFAAINGEHPTFTDGGVAQLLATYRRSTPVNVAYLAPLGTIRYAVLGAEDRPATDQELRSMTTLLNAAFTEGACGMSTGLEYLPGAYADAGELAQLARVATARGLPHVSHMRGYDDEAGPAFAELADIARASGVSTHVSHYHGPALPLTGYLDRALTEGLDFTFDSYPYDRGCSILSMVALPTWLPLADAAATMATLADPVTLQRLRTGHLARLEHLWPRVTLAAAPTDPPGQYTWAEGRTIPDIAAQRGVCTSEAVLDLLLRTRLRASCVFSRPSRKQSDSPRPLIRHRAHMAGSDAIYSGGHPHPRGWGAFARFLSEHVIRLGDWTWYEAIQHLSYSASQRFRLPGRGELRPGAVADIALVDPERVRDEATYADPRRVATGIDDVLVAGTPVLAAGSLTGALAGAPVRPARGRKEVVNVPPHSPERETLELHEEGSV